MRLIILTSLMLIFHASVFFAQKELIIGSAEYEIVKNEGKLSDYVLKLNESSFAPKEGAVYTPVEKGYPTKSSVCDCYVQPDATYTLAMAPNDDGSSPLINIPFNFNFYGQTYTSFYINNNGNITFVNSLFSFSSNAFPSSPDQIIAPFWADVDTRDNNGQVVYKITPNAIYINWEGVGYYSQQGDKLNTFQLIMSDGTDPAIPDGNNVAFCYQDMQWTAGSASSGVNGFGGIPATCGANKGDNLAYFLIARFDHAGNDFDGALGNPDGISWLDNKSFFFDVTNSGNVPPIPEGVAACDTFRICSFGDTADISINFFAPEANQTTSITYTNGGLTTLQEIVNNSGNTAQLVLRVIGDPASAGVYSINVTATDDFVPAGVTSMNFVIVIEDIGAGMNPILNYTQACDSMQVTVLNGPYDTYLWDDLVTLPSTYADETGDFGVTVSLNGCYKRVEDFIYVHSSAPFDLQGNLYLCPSEDSTFITIGDSALIDVMDWNLGNLSLDTLFHNWLTAGTYTITNMDSTGLCSNDTTFTIVQAVQATIFNDTVYCNNLAFQVVNSSLGTSSVWSSPDPEISFSNTSIANPVITASTYGVYTINLSSPCENDLETVITFPSPPLIFGDTSICETIFGIPLNQVETFGAATWSVSPSGGFTPSSTESATAFNAPNDGVYTMTLTDDVCPNKSASAVITVLTPPTVDIQSLACDLIATNIYSTFPAGGQITWSILDNPSTGFLEDTAATYINGTDQNSAEPDYYVSSPGTYTLSYNITGTCPLSGSEEIYFPPYNYTQIVDTMLCDGTEYQMEAYQTGGNVNYSWNTGAIGPYISITEPGTYIVTVTNECPSHTFIDSAQVGYYTCEIDAPNVISLSSLNGNNVWFVTADGIQDFECTIVNRWGNTIYEYNDIGGYWDGRAKSGNYVEEGVYFYKINTTIYGGKELQKHGFIQVIQ